LKISPIFSPRSHNFQFLSSKKHRKRRKEPRACKRRKTEKSFSLHSQKKQFFFISLCRHVYLVFFRFIWRRFGRKSIAQIDFVEWYKNISILVFYILITKTFLCSTPHGTRRGLFVVLSIIVCRQKTQKFILNIRLELFQLETDLRQKFSSHTLEIIL
jgi:hypothetical protein